MGMKAWSNSPEESADMIKSIGEHIGFTATGRIEVFKTEPTQPPSNNPNSYDINFTPYNEE